MDVVSIIAVSVVVGTRSGRDGEDPDSEEDIFTKQLRDLDEL